MPSGTTQAVIGALVLMMTAFGLSWVNSAADYSRYLPRSASTGGVIGWTTFGGAVAPVILLVYGLLLVGSRPRADRPDRGRSARHAGHAAPERALARRRHRGAAHLRRRGRRRAGRRSRARHLLVRPQPADPRASRPRAGWLPCSTASSWSSARSTSSGSRRTSSVPSRGSSSRWVSRSRRGAGSSWPTCCSGKRRLRRGRPVRRGGTLRLRQRRPGAAHGHQRGRRMGAGGELLRRLRLGGLPPRPAPPRRQDGHLERSQPRRRVRLRLLVPRLPAAVHGAGPPAGTGRVPGRRRGDPSDMDAHGSTVEVCDGEQARAARRRGLRRVRRGLRGPPRPWPSGGPSSTTSTLPATASGWPWPGTIDRLVGFAWGYVGRRGQYWSDWVVR